MENFYKIEIISIIYYFSTSSQHKLSFWKKCANQLLQLWAISKLKLSKHIHLIIMTKYEDMRLRRILYSNDQLNPVKIKFQPFALVSLSKITTSNSVSLIMYIQASLPRVSYSGTIMLLLLYVACSHIIHCNQIINQR